MRVNIALYFRYSLEASLVLNRDNKSTRSQLFAYWLGPKIYESSLQFPSFSIATYKQLSTNSLSLSCPNSMVACGSSFALSQFPDRGIKGGWSPRCRQINRTFRRTPRSQKKAHQSYISNCWCTGSNTVNT